MFFVERRGASAVLRFEIERKIHFLNEDIGYELVKIQSTIHIQSHDFKAQSVLQMQLLFRGILHWYRPPIETPDPAVRT